MSVNFNSLDLIGRFANNYNKDKFINQEAKQTLTGIIDVIKSVPKGSSLTPKEKDQIMASLKGLKKMEVSRISSKNDELHNKVNACIQSLKTPNVEVVQHPSKKSSQELKTQGEAQKVESYMSSSGRSAELTRTRTRRINQSVLKRSTITSTKAESRKDSVRTEFLEEKVTKGNSKNVSQTRPIKSAKNISGNGKQNLEKKAFESMDNLLGSSSFKRKCKDYADVVTTLKNSKGNLSPQEASKALKDTEALLENLSTLINTQAMRDTITSDLSNIKLYLKNIAETENASQSVPQTNAKLESRGPSKLISRNRSPASTKRSLYTNARFSESRNTLTINKISKTGEEVVKKLIKSDLKGEGGNAAVHSFKSESGNMQKAVRKSLESGNESSNKQDIKAQFINLNTGKPVKNVPGLAPPSKFAGKTASSNFEIQTLYENNMLEIKNPLTFNQAIMGTGDLLFGLAHFHSDGGELKPAMVHRDMKPENILFAFDKDGKLKLSIIDMEGAHRADGKAHWHDIDESPGYLSGDELDIRELFKGGAKIDEISGKYNQYYQSLDVRNLGVSLFTLLTGNKPATLDSEITPDDIMDSIKNDPSADPEKLEKLCTLINKMTETWWYQRITAKDAKEEFAAIGYPLPDYS